MPERKSNDKTKTFNLGAVLTVTTGRFLVDDIGDLYNILNYMTGDELMTHQLPRASEEVAPDIIRQHPQLADVVVPDTLKDRGSCMAWLQSVGAEVGTAFELTPVAAEDHTHIDPLQELHMMRPGMPVIGVVIPDTEGE